MQTSHVVLPLNDSYCRKQLEWFDEGQQFVEGFREESHERTKLISEGDALPTVADLDRVCENSF